MTDDAYFGLFYGEDVAQESLFAKLAGCHERLLAVKVDGPTKEEFVWGFRTGMLTFGAQGLPQRRSPLSGLGEEGRGGHPQRRLELFPRRPIGLGEGHVERACRPSGGRRRTSSKPGRRKSKRSSARPSLPNLWEPYPFNAGYFMCLKLKGIDAETFRKHLLEKYGVGVIADGERDIRIAFSSVDEAQLEDLYAVLAAAARDLLDGEAAAAK